ncbi:MAG: Uma2 family endonuclease [Pseudonocardia sp.]|nr:Uma2 family endonuclease [Pseudonocardia sp.]
MVVPPVARHHMTLREFLLAWEAGAYGKRVELLDGDVWDVPIGDWHAETTGEIISALPKGDHRVVAGSLPAGESLPEPDCWLRPRTAQRVMQLSPRLSRWAAEDVALVVEIADETIDYDLGRKADLYAEAGFAYYWVVTKDGIFVHGEPCSGRYLHRRLHKPGERIAVPYAEGVELDVEQLIAA